jgi:hypothetical protein
MKVCDLDLGKRSSDAAVVAAPEWRTWLLEAGRALSPSAPKRDRSATHNRRKLLFIGVPGQTSAAQLICLSAVMHEAAFGSNTSRQAHLRHLNDVFDKCHESPDLQAPTRIRSVRPGEASLVFKFVIDGRKQIRIEEDRAKIRESRFRNSHKRSLQLPRSIGPTHCHEYFLDGQLPIFNPEPGAGTLSAAVESCCEHLGMLPEEITRARIESQFFDNSIALIMPPSGRDAYLRDCVIGHLHDLRLSDFVNAAQNPNGPSRLQLLSSRGDSLLKEMDAAAEISKAPPQLVIVEGIEAMVRLGNVLAGDSSRWTCNGPFRGDIVCIADTCEPNEQLEALGSLIHERESYFETCELPAELRALPSGFSARLMVERQSS